MPKRLIKRDGWVNISYKSLVQNLYYRTWKFIFYMSYEWKLWLKFKHLGFVIYMPMNQALKAGTGIKASTRNISVFEVG